MKKKIFSVTFVVALAAIAGYNTYVNQTEVEMSDMALANVEALAGPEGESVQTCGTHYETINDKKKCEMDNLYSQGFVGIEYSQTTGTDKKYWKGFRGLFYICTSTSGIPQDNVKEYDCGKDEFSDIFDFLN